MERTISLLAVMFLFAGMTRAQSPYESSWGRDGTILGAGIVTAFVASAIDDSLPPLTLQDVSGLSRSSVNWFDRSATYNSSTRLAGVSDVLAGTAIVAPLALLIDPDIRDGWGTFVLMYIETMTFATFIPSFPKGSVERFRPFVYNPDISFDFKQSNDPKRSFFSGHTTMAFAASVFLATVYSDHHPNSEYTPYVWTVSLLAAGGVGYLRYASGAHFPTDVLTGAVVGSAVGYLVPMLHRHDDSGITVAPATVGAAHGLSLRYRF